jgi:Peptidase family M41/ATPase family associated with various cellular activities (AAA)
MLKIDKKIIAERKQHLEDTKKVLKKQFIGIDDIIDNLLEYIQVWYLMPEILNRPVIVNLWGMTGVGKTDLIRKMIKSLNYQDRFTEVELSNTDETSWERSVSSILDNHGFHDGKPCVVLFDEIQRFNTVDSDGRPLPQTKFTDFWELLSDGHLSKKQRTDLDYYLNNFMGRQKDAQRRKAKGEEVVDETLFVNYWEAASLKKTLNLDMEVEEMTDLSEKQMVDMIMGAKKKKTIYEPINHAKTLIIISGNLDDAFQMATQTSEADIDADIFHAYTKKITVVDVKNALSRKFRPEQVARFGNIHLIYNSLRKIDFEHLIEREIERVVRETKEKIGITLKIDPSINALIYRNGVFPVQGVRPVFSSVIDILDANISNFVFNAIMGDESKIEVKYDAAAKKIVAKIGKNTEEMAYVGRIDKIRNSNIEDTVANISVHECGHAIAYMALMGMAPLQLKSKVASSYAGGFTFPHQIHETKENIIRKIKIYLAGGIAEEIVFGKQNASVGRSHDREQVTTLALDYVRRYGFDEEFQATYTLEFAYSMDKTATDTDVEKMISRLVGETKELLGEHRELLYALSMSLYRIGSLEAKEVAAIAQQFGLQAQVREEGFLYINTYRDSLEQGRK